MFDRSNDLLLPLVSSGLHISFLNVKICCVSFISLSI